MMTALNTNAPAQANGKGFFRGRLFGRLLLHCSALLLFILFFVGTALLVFPKVQLRDYVEGQIQRQTGQRISIGQLSFSPFLQVEAGPITWQPSNVRIPPVTVDRLTASPVWTSLFGKNPAGHIHLAIAGGTVDGRYARNGSCNAKLVNVEIAPFVDPKFPFPPAGRIGGTVALQKAADSKGDIVVFDLAAEDLKVGGLSSFGLAKKDLALGRVQLRGQMVGNTFKLEALQNEGGDLSITGHGSILVNPVPSHSRLNLQFDLRPTPALASSLGGLLQLAGLKSRGEGDYKFRLLGSPLRPVLR